jgi:hypothetical protein
MIRTDSYTDNVKRHRVRLDQPINGSVGALGVNALLFIDDATLRSWRDAGLKFTLLPSEPVDAGNADASTRPTVSDGYSHRSAPPVVTKAIETTGSESKPKKAATEASAAEAHAQGAQSPAPGK